MHNVKFDEDDECRVLGLKNLLWRREKFYHGLVNGC